MGVDAQGYFKINGRPATYDELADLRERLRFADFGLPKDWGFANRFAFTEISFDLARYYGPGYERGPILEIATLLGWLLRNLPEGSAVYYGGDSVDLEELSEWTLGREREYLDHYFRVGHEPYRKAFHR